MDPKVAIIGGGPAGTTLSIALFKRGIDSVIIEKEKFPRFHIGESMTGECGASVRALGIEANMKEKRYPVKWGTMVYGANGRNKYHIPVMQRTKEGTLAKQITWQVRRSDFDNMLLEQVRANGIETITAQVTDVIKIDNHLRGVRYNVNGKEQDLYADIIADCSGQGTFLANRGVTSEKIRGKYHNQTAIFSHFKGCVRPEPGEEDQLKSDDTLIFYSKKNHWAWFIPLDDEIVSIGVVCPSDYFKSRKESKRSFLLREMRTLNVKLSERIQNARMVEEVHACSSYSYQIMQFTGENWLCVGDAHRFIDPIFSFGLHFAMAEGQKAALAIDHYINGKNINNNSPFSGYQVECEKGMDVIQDMLDAFWDYPLAFSLYTRDKRYRDDFIDMFAGRVYNIKPSEGLLALRALNSRIN